MSVPRSWQISDFEVGRQIGSGQHSTVYLVREKSTGFICAIKMIPKETILESRTEYQVLQEIKILLTVKYAFFKIVISLKIAIILL